MSLETAAESENPEVKNRQVDCLEPVVSSQPSVSSARSWRATDGERERESERGRLSNTLETLEQIVRAGLERKACLWMGLLLHGSHTSPPRIIMLIHHARVGVRGCVCVCG